jgi:hypothetical protein
MPLSARSVPDAHASVHVPSPGPASRDPPDTRTSPPRAPTPGMAWEAFPGYAMVHLAPTLIDTTNVNPSSLMVGALNQRQYIRCAMEPALTDYRLEGLSPRSFEHLIQALALRFISSTVTPYGDGPDGGREATFDGATRYGAAGSYWNGRGVLQAKFLQRPQSSYHDGQWAKAQLAKELKKYTVAGSNQVNFDYYIFVTNAVLTPARGKGSKDAIDQMLNTFAVKFKLKGVDIWDYDKLRLLIDRDKEVRRTYAAWITPGDILYDIAEHLAATHRDDYKLIVKYLQRELLADQYAKLEQAGHSADEAIPLARVFIDLPTAPRPSSREEYAQQHDRQRFVQYIVEDARHSFAPTATEAASSGKRTVNLSKEVHRGRHMLIGGPGQGKTTIGQYICQVFRCALLRDVPTERLSADAEAVIAGLSAQWNFTVPITRRVPFRIVLSDFARSLAADESRSLLGYLAKKFTDRTDVIVSAEQIEPLLTQYPSVIVLDGLDEVPPSTNRDEVLAAITDFSIDVASNCMDVMIIATSRPQGYNDEFSPRQYTHHYLLPLTQADALDYGYRLSKVRFVGDDDRITKVNKRLERAASTPATARLMRSPLQVTILTLLVDRIGHPPEERWALFRDYYRLIYERETEREIPAVKVLKEHREDVDAIHRRVGLLLQVESERSGGTDARLTVEQFGKLVEDYLVEEGNTGAVVAQLRDAIINAAANRLVFLVGLEANQVGFEIRSLQEFMAAEGLMDARDGVAQKRLKAVAPSTNWRNVFLLAAGKCFAERRYLRDTIESICVDLNDDPDNEEFRKLLVGSELALDLLEDGPARRQPMKRRSLTRLALRLLGESPSVAERLAGICERDTRDIFLERLREQTASANSHTRELAWDCLGRLIDRYGEEFEVLGRAANEEYPLSDDVVENLIDITNGSNRWLTATLFAELSRRGLLLKSGDKWHREDEESIKTYGPWRLSDWPSWLSWYARYVDMAWVLEHDCTLKISSEEGVLEARIWLRSLKSASLSGLLTAPVDLPDVAPRWRWIVAAGRFCADPCIVTLADALSLLTNADIRASVPDFLIAQYPWPLAECTRASLADPSVNVLDFVISGQYGDIADWSRLERQWLDEGMFLEQIATASPLYSWGDKDVIWELPYRSILRTDVRVGDPIQVVKAFDSSHSLLVRRLLVDLLLDAPENFVTSALGNHDASAPPGKLAGGWIDKILYHKCLMERYICPEFFVYGASVDLSDDKWSSLFSEMPLSALFSYSYRLSGTEQVVNSLWETWQNAPSLVGLLVPLSALYASGEGGDLGAPRERIRVEQACTPAVHAAALLLNIHSGVGVDELTEEMRAVVSRNAVLAGVFAEAVLSCNLNYVDANGELVRLITMVGPEAAIVVRRALLNHFSRRGSGLGEAERWNALEFSPSLLRLA